MAVSDDSRVKLRGVELQWCGRTDVGKRRTVNEDSVLVGPGLFAVADGMGGHEAGDVASRLAVDACRTFLDAVPLDLDDLEALVAAANSRVVDHAAAHGIDGMGTTLVGVALLDNEQRCDLVAFNVGDSRCYQLSDTEFTRITRDHSVVQELLDSGALHPDQAATHAERNVVTRAIGIAPSVACDYFVLPRLAEARLLLCSDGVSGEVSDAHIAGILANAADPASAVDAIFDAVLGTPARDNATAVVIDVRRPDLQTTQDPTGRDTTQPRPRTRASSKRIADVPVTNADPNAVPAGGSSQPLIDDVPR